MSHFQAWFLRVFVNDWRAPFVIVTIVASSALFLAVYFFVVNTSTNRELCQLNASRLYDKERQIKQSENFLRSPQGMKSDLRDFIRTNSLPRLRREVRLDRENFPPRCNDLLVKR